ncbi:MAG: LysE family translocator, partial [Pseudomonadota bacterium]
KAWAMALGAVSAYVVEPSALAYAAVAGTFALVNLPSVSIWAGAGQAVRRWLDGPGRLKAFNWTMAGLLVLSLWPVVTLEM